MEYHATRSITNKLQSITQRLGFTNEIQDIRLITNVPNIVIIVEKPNEPQTEATIMKGTRVIVMSLTDSNYFYDKHWIGFPDSLTNANIHIDDDGFNQFLVINGPGYAVYYTLSSTTVA